MSCLLSGNWIIHEGTYTADFKEWLYTVHPEIKVFVYLADEGYYGVQGAVKPGETFRKSRTYDVFPEQWRGLRDVDLASVCGLKSAYFCSDKGYIAGFWKKEDAIEAAKYVARRQELLEMFDLEE